MSETQTQTIDLTNQQTFEAELAKLEAQEGETETTATADDDSTPATTSEDAISGASGGQDTVPADEEEEVITTDKGKMVPYSRVKEMAQKNQEEREARIKSDERLAMLMDALQSKQQKENELISQTQEVSTLKNEYDPDIQPVEYLKREIEIRDAKIDAIANEVKADKETRSQQYQVQKMLSSADADIADAVKLGTIPDAQERAAYLLQSKAKEFSLFYPQDKAQEAVRNYSLSVIGAAKERGMTVAQYVKELSDVNGYKPQDIATKQKTQSRNVEAISKNKAKSSSLVSSAPAELNGAPTTIKAAMNKSGRGVDDEAFRRMLQQLES